MDWFYDVTGLWQQSWMLFAPEVAKENVSQIVKLTTEDGEETGLRSRDWSKQGTVSKWLRAREINYEERFSCSTNDLVMEAYLERVTSELRGGFAGGCIGVGRTVGRVALHP